MESQKGTWFEEVILSSVSVEVTLGQQSDNVSKGVECLL